MGTHIFRFFFKLYIRYISPLPGTPASDRDDAAPTPSAQFLAAAAFDLDYEYVVAASFGGGGISPDSDQEPDPPEVASVVKDIFRLDGEL